MKLKPYFTFFVFILFICNLNAITFSKPDKLKEVINPCVEKSRSDKNFFRTSASSKSSDMASAKDKALLMAKQMIVSLIGTTLTNVTTIYGESLEKTNATVFGQSVESLSREVANQQLKKVTITCEKTIQNKDGKFECFVAIEVPKEIIITELSKKITENKKLETNFNRIKFTEVLDSEMEKLTIK